MSFPAKIDNSQQISENERSLDSEGFDPLAELERIRNEWDTELRSFVTASEETQVISAENSEPAPEPDITEKQAEIATEIVENMECEEQPSEKLEIERAEEIENTENLENAEELNNVNEKVETHPESTVEKNEQPENVEKIATIERKIEFRNSEKIKKANELGEIEKNIFASVAKNPTAGLGIQARPDKRSPAIYSQISHSPTAVAAINAPKDAKRPELRDLGDFGELGDLRAVVSRPDSGNAIPFTVAKQTDISESFSGLVATPAAEKLEKTEIVFRASVNPPLGTSKLAEHLQPVREFARETVVESAHEPELDSAPSTANNELPEKSKISDRGELSEREQIIENSQIFRSRDDFGHTSSPNFRKSNFEAVRIDPPHTQTGQEEDYAIVPVTEMPISELFGWFCVALGLVGVIVGTLFHLKGILTEMVAIWTYGMPIALVGALIIVFGLLVQLRRLMKLRVAAAEAPEKSEKGRYVAKQLTEIQQRLNELRVILNEENVSKNQP